jgi:hypothetical protein
VGIRWADHATLSIRKKLALTSRAIGGRSVGIVRLRTKCLGVLFWIGLQFSNKRLRFKLLTAVSTKSKPNYLLECDVILSGRSIYQTTRWHTPHDSILITKEHLLCNAATG